MKKFLSLLLAVAMMLSLGIPALADEATGSTTGTTTTITSTDSGSNSANKGVQVYYTPGTPEAKWAASKDALAGADAQSGTLKEAFEAAAAAGSTVKYIQLQRNVTATDGYKIAGGTFTLDLNGCTMSSEYYTLTLNSAAANVTLVDTSEAKTGKIVGSSSAAAVRVENGTLTIEGGSYEGLNAVNMFSSDTAITQDVTIKGGSFTGTMGSAVYNREGTLTITGGSFTSSGPCVIDIYSDAKSTTITGGSFTPTESYVYHIRYRGGKLDLSNYSGTTPLTDMKVINKASSSVTVGDDTIKLPDGYAFALASDAAKTPTTTLQAGSAYIVVRTAAAPKIEAKWGADKENLTGSGTLEEAIRAANADSTIQYIQIQLSVNVTIGYTIRRGDLTIDLNGKTVRSTQTVFTVSYSPASAASAYALRARAAADGGVTFTDSSTHGTGSVVSSASSGAAISVPSGAVTISGGSYTGTTAVTVGDGTGSSDSSVTIDGGSFNGTGNNTIENKNGELSIEGGSISAGTKSAVAISGGTTAITSGSFYPSSSGSSNTIQFNSGTLDVSDYHGATSVSIDNQASDTTFGEEDTGSDNHIILPTQHTMHDGENEVAEGTTLTQNTTYSIAGKSTDEPEYDATWGATQAAAEAEDAAGGTLADAFDAAKDDSSIKYIQLQKNVPTSTGYEIEGGSFTIDLHGHTISNDGATAVTILTINSEQSSVTLTDTTSGGAVKSNNALAGNALHVCAGKVTITGGTYQANGGVAVNCTDGCAVTIWSGQFTSASTNGAILNSGMMTVYNGSFSATADNTSVLSNENDGTLTIYNGTFSATGEDAESISNGNVLTIESGYFTGRVAQHGGSATITGGTFTNGFKYNGGKLDLTGLTDFTGLTVYNTANNLTVGDDNIKLPEGYGFYESDDTTQTIVTALAVNTKYSIKSTTGGTTTDEAKWGDSASDLSESGTLAKALEEAAKADSTVTYIQLQKDIENVTTAYTITGGTFTLDLNGYSITGSSQLFTVNGENADVTFQDGKSSGTVKTTAESDPGITVTNGEVKITSGHYEGKKMAVAAAGSSDAVLTITGGSFAADSSIEPSCAVNNMGGSVTIEGGSFAAGKYSAVTNGSGTLTITGGSFTTGTQGHIYYNGGKIDLSSYGMDPDVTMTAITELIVGWGVDNTSNTGVTLPAGYGFYKSDDLEKKIVTSFAKDKNYMIVLDPEAKWGTSAGNLTGAGTLNKALAEAENAGNGITYVQLVKDINAPVSNGVVINASKDFTLDLNGHSITGTGNGPAVCVNNTNATVTFTDGGNGGKVTSASEGDSAIVVVDGGAIIAGGTFSGTTYALGVSGGTLTVEKGTFTASTSSFCYGGGKLDLSGYQNTAITDLTIQNSSEGTVTVSDTTIALPGGYGLSVDGTSIVTTLAKDTAYSIIKEPETYTVTISASENGTVTAEPAAAIKGETVTLTVTPDENYQLENLTVTYGTESTTVTTTEGTDGKYTFAMPEGAVTVTATFEPIPAEITGVSVEVKDASGTPVSASDTGVYTIYQNYTVTITVSGTYFANLSESNQFALRASETVGAGYALTNSAWTIVGNTATMTMPSSAFKNYTGAVQLVYSNNDGTNWVYTGIYIQYHETISVSITWGAMSFEYNTDKAEGSETPKGWEPSADGANKVTVTNSSDVAVTASVKYEAVEDYTDISGTFDNDNATLGTSDPNNTATFALTLTGEPGTTSFTNATVGTITVTIGRTGT